MVTKSYNLKAARQVNGNWDKYRLLMWKNWKMVYRNKWGIVKDIVVPIVFALVLVMTRIFILPERITEDVTFNSLTPNNMHIIRFLAEQVNVDLQWNLAYSPKSSNVDELMESVSRSLNLTTTGFESEKDLLSSIVLNDYPFACVIFNDSLINSAILPMNLSYDIRFPSKRRFSNGNWNTNRMAPTLTPSVLRARNVDHAGSAYYLEGFLAVQHAISMAFIDQKKRPDVVIPEVLVRRFPFPASQMDFITNIMQTLLSAILVICFVPPAMNITKLVAVEREKQLKEIMKIMGLADWLHWTSWFTKFFLNMVIVVFAIVGLLKLSFYPDFYASILTHSNWSVVWLFTMVYAISVITYSFMISTLIKSPSSASLLTGVTIFILYVPYFIFLNLGVALSHRDVMGLSLLNSMGMAFGFEFIMKLEDRQEGLQWNNLFSPIELRNGISVGLVMIMLLVGSIVYMLIALYTEKIKPGDYGVPEKWYFPFSPTFWCGKSRKIDSEDLYFHDEKQCDVTSETPPKGKEIGISIRNLRKVYSTGKVAVQGLSLNMYQDEITVLLGHNGAGKTTTISMLTGMIPATSGTALINRNDIRTDMEQVRGFIGICPQHNILFDELTVRDHIQFYGLLKGLPRSEINLEVQKYVKSLQFEDKVDAPSSTLSGGMKRKLCIGIALCGNSKFVLFDEPTAGMDPTARRALWDLLQAEKKDRTIILSTHFMDEADVLGDRIAIMHGGQLKCYGSSYFLKKEFGHGYSLIFEKGQNCNVMDVSETLESFIPAIEMTENVGTELSYRLPECYAKAFEPMLRTIEDNADSLGILGYGISVTTLEEVFLTVGSDNDSLELAHSESLSTASVSDAGSTITLLDPSELLSGSSLRINQWLAMIMKNVFYSTRNYVVTILILAIPTLFVFLTIISARAFVRVNVLPPLEISLEAFNFRTMNVLSRNSTEPTEMVQRMMDSYLGLVAGNTTRHRVRQTDEFINPHLLRVGRHNFAEFTRHYITSASMSEKWVTAWFSNQYFHTPAVALQLVYNSILEAAAGKEAQLTLRNNPLPYTLNDQMNFSNNYSEMGFQIMLNMGCGMVVGMSLYILFYIKEQASKAKLLQFVSGVSVWIFWTTIILCDFLKYFFSVFIGVIALAVFQSPGWSSGDELGRVVALMACFGFAVFPLLYLLSFINSDPSNGFNNSAMIGFGSMVLFIMTLQMRHPAADMEFAADVLDWIFMLSPYYAFAHALFNMNTMNAITSACQRRCAAIPGCKWDKMCTFSMDCCTLDFFDWKVPGIGRNIGFLTFVGVVFFLIVFLRELGYFKHLHYKMSTAKGYPNIDLRACISMDSDVATEKQRVQNMSCDEIQTSSLVMKDMSKFYKDLLAVNSVCVGVEESECFGLLGVNGAGKTSTFKMLTGDEFISSGEAWIKGHSLKGEMKRIYPFIGYCPQFDAMLEDLTGRETMTIFCLLRGLPRARIPPYTMKLAKELNFFQHIDKRIREYSGGNKRKLSTALALIGDPAVIFLDEPTAGMDPGAKRNLWNVISKIRAAGKTIVLTSHSMEECEALCTKLTIMVNGEFKCMGSLQYLKNKFSKGYILTVQVVRSCQFSNEDNSEEIKLVNEYIVTHLIGASLKEDYQGRMTYYIKNTSLKWSTMFGIMEKAKETLCIENYSLTQTTLEQIFLDFAQSQKT